jgi:hypothetical protein
MPPGRVTCRLPQTQEAPARIGPKFRGSAPLTVNLVDLFTVDQRFSHYFDQLRAITAIETTILRGQRFNIAKTAILAGKLYL